MKPLVAEVALHRLLGRVYPEDSAGTGGQVGGDSGSRGWSIADDLLQTKLCLHLDPNNSLAAHTDRLWLLLQGADLACWTVNRGVNLQDIALSGGGTVRIILLTSSTCFSMTATDSPHSGQLTIIVLSESGRRAFILVGLCSN